MITILGILSNETMKERRASFLVRCVGFLYNGKKMKQADKMYAVYKHHLMYANGEQFFLITDLIEYGKIKAMIELVFRINQLHDTFAEARRGGRRGIL